MTRFYLPASPIQNPSPLGGPAPYGPTWTDLTETEHLALLSAPAPDADKPGQTSLPASTPAGTYKLGGQWVSAPVPAQTLDGTVAACLYGFQVSDKVQATLHLRVAVCSADGSTIRGTMYEGPLGGPVPEGGANRSRYGVVPLNPTAVQAGDRLVIEIGLHKAGSSSWPAGAGTTASHLWPGDLPAANDVSWNDDLRPWVEFSADVFNPPAPPTPNPNRGYLEKLFGGCPLFMTIAGTDVTPGRIGPTSITRGRDGHTDRVAASVLTTTLIQRGTDPLPVLGDTITVDLGDAAATFFGVAADPAARRRFTGRITDIRLSPLVGNGNVSGALQITAAGPKATLGRIQVGGNNWPAENDSARAARILDAAAALDPTGTLTRGTTDPPVYELAARAGSAGYALALIDTLAGDVSGECAETRAGVLVWQSAEHRRTLPSILELDACSVIAPGTEWLTDSQGLVNDLTVNHGPAAASTVQITDPAAMTGPIGRYASEVTSPLADTIEATSWATDVIARRGRPRWRMPILTLELTRSVTPAEAATLLEAETPALITLLNLPDIAPVGLTDGRMFIEGSTEQWTRDGITYALAVTTHALTGPSPRWMDVDPAITWADVPSDLSWLGATSWDALPEGTP